MHRSATESPKAEQELKVENLLWSDEEYKISDFVDKFPLPQIVKVQEGYYGPDEDSCLGAEQVLFIHALKHTEKVFARDRRLRELHIPLNCSRKVEERPANLKDFYERVSDIARHFPKFVRVTQGYYSLEDDSSSIYPGDKLELQNVLHDEKVLVCTNQERFPVRLPLTVVAGFQPLLDGLEYYLKELVATTQRPFFFQFVDPPNIGVKGESSVFNSGLGVLRLEKVYTDSTIICSTKEGKDRTVVTFPKDLQVTVTAAKGALVGDKQYMRVCRFFHDGVNLTRIENMDSHNVYASRTTIREYLYNDALADAPSSPEVPSESMPPKETHFDKYLTQSASSKEKSGHGSNDSGASSNSNQHSDDDHEYMYISDDEFDRLASLRSQTNNNEHKKVQENGSKQELQPEKGNEVTTEANKNDAVTTKNEKRSQQATSSDHNPPAQPHITHTLEQLIPMAPIPDDLSELSIEEVSQVLQQVHLHEFVTTFEYNQIDGDMLVSLDEEVLESLGMNAFQRKKILKLIGGWRPKKANASQC